MEDNNLKVNMAEMRKDISHMRENVDHINNKLDKFINKVENNYATKRELNDHKCRIKDNENSIEELKVLYRRFLLWSVVTLLSIFGFLVATAKDVFINNIF
jgi:peptidoglycan hydrolase CwlO-like protein